MHVYISLIPLIYLLAAIPYGALGLYAWQRRPAAAIIPYAWMMLAMAIWSFVYSFEILSPDLQTKLKLNNIEYFSVVSIPVLFLMFALEFSGRGHFLTRRYKTLLWSIPLVVLVLVSTNEYHKLLWDHEMVIESYGLLLLQVKHQPFYWINVAYSYILLLIANLLLVMEIVQRPGIYRLQASLIIMGLLSPWFGNIIYLAGLSPFDNLDLTVFFFIPASMALGWMVKYYRWLDVIPPEHITILQNIRDGLIVVDTRQRILYLNPIAEHLFAKTEHAVIGQPLSMLSDEFSSIINANLSAQEIRFEHVFDRMNKKPVFEVTLSPIYPGRARETVHPAGYVFNLHDISLRKKAEMALSRREAILSAISLAAEQFLKESAWEHNIPHMLEKIGQATDVSRVYVAMNYLAEDGILYTSLCYEWAAPGISGRINEPGLQHVQLREAGFERWDEILRKGQSISGLVREFPASEQNLLQLYQIQSMMVVPIFVDQQWWGFIGLDDCQRERAWTNNEIDTLHLAANLFGTAEARSRTELKLIRRQHTLNLLHEIVVLSLKASNLQSMSQDLVDKLGEMMKANRCFITLWDETYQQVIPLSAYVPDRENFLSLRPAPWEATFTASALLTEQPLVIEDVQNSPMRSYRFLKVFPAKSLIAFPLIAGGNHLGAIILTYQHRYYFQADEIELGEQASDLIALSLEKFKAMEHAHRRAEESEILRKAGVAVNETLDTQEAVASVLEQLAQVIPYNSASVQIFNENTLEIIGARGWESEKSVLGVRFPIPGDNPNTVVIQTGRYYYLPEIDKIYASFQNPYASHIRSWLGIPLMVKGQVIGMISIDRSKPNAFTKENIDLAVAFADQAASKLQNTIRFEEVQSQALTDALTGLYNRRGLFELGRVEFSNSNLMGRPFSGIMIDIDHFKQVNDTYGHHIGDQVLCELARRCKSCVREIDYVCRYGGEEIIILLPETDMDKALEVGERLRLAIASQPMQVEHGLELHVTASFGVAHRDKNTTSLETLIARADQAMYIAKHKGRNCVASSV
jgi:diguanylate cyclase (GGDEF)-like protein/PAS domain S-box-containing protein